jgi:hypothetical protein
MIHENVNILGRRDGTVGVVLPLQEDDQISKRSGGSQTTAVAVVVVAAVLKLRPGNVENVERLEIVVSVIQTAVVAPIASEITAEQRKF